MRHHLTPVRMTTIKNTENSKCWQGCGEKRTLMHYWWECKLVQPLWKTVWWFLKKLKIELLYTVMQAHFWYTSRRNEVSILKKYLHSYFHCSIIYTIQDTEATSVQFSSVIQLCPTLYDPMNCSTPGLAVHHQLPEFTQTHVQHYLHYTRHGSNLSIYK